MTRHSVAPSAEDMLAKVCRDARAIRQRGDLDAWLENRRIGFDPPIDWVSVIAKGVIVAGFGVSVALWVVR